MSDLADSDANRQQQLGSSGEYNPTGRAAAGMRAAKAAGAGSHPVVSDGPNNAGAEQYSTPKDSKEPSPKSTPKAPATDAAYTDSQDPGLKSRGVADRGL